jgi:hypothetical protein
MQAVGIVKELVLLNGIPAAWIQCDPSMIPAPGQYLLAYAGGSNSPLAVPVFLGRSFADNRKITAGSFLAAPPIPAAWGIGTRLYLRGPLGHGFLFPNIARRIALIAFDDLPLHLTALLDAALKQEASIVMVCKDPPDDLPLQVEVQPLDSLMDVCAWADYTALDARRESLLELMKIFAGSNRLRIGNEVQVLIRAPMPCGALAECGVCSLDSGRGALLVCKDGPVFNLKDLLD